MGMRMGRWVAVGAVLALAACGGDGGVGYGRVVAVNSCQAELASILRDPESLEVENVETERGEDEPHGWVVSGDYRARNGFGGMNSDFFTCVTGPAGDDPVVLTGEQLDDE